MRISVTYPAGATKLYHVKSGKLVQIARNDGHVDSNFYIVTNQVEDKNIVLLDVATGKLCNTCRSVRVVQFPNANIDPYGHDE